MLVARGFAQSDPPQNYYTPAMGTTGVALKATLHNIIKNHTVLPYTSTSTDTWDAVKMLDEDPADSASVILIYSGLTNLKSNQYASGVGAGKWDREHLFPQSFGIVAVSASSRAKTDVFNLRPIDYTVNSTRNNLFYDTTTTPFHTMAGAPGASYDSDSWEPRDDDKGVVARAAFYMATRYDGTDADVPDLELSDTPDAATYHFGKLSTLLAWNRQHPPTDAERHRNQLIYDNLQHNRNPFIDHPEFADIVFTSATPLLAWKSLRFTTSELSNPAISSDEANPDGDGEKNLLEFFFNRSPKVAESTPALIATAAADGSVLLTYPHNRFASGVTVTFETSPDLAAWSATSPASASATTMSFDTEQITARLSRTTTPFYVRMRVTVP